MKKEKENKRFKNLLTLYEAAALYMQEDLSNMQRNMRQYLGSDEIDGSSKRADMVRNITYELIEAEISANIPAPKIEPSIFSERREENARTLEELCADCISRLPFEELNDTDERYTYIYGGSVWYVEWDGEEVRVHSLSPESFIPEPGIYSVEDMRYCFIRSRTTRGELMERYGVTPDRKSGRADSFESDADPLYDTVEVVVAFYLDEEGEVGKMMFTGDTLLFDMPKYFYRRDEEGNPILSEELFVDGKTVTASVIAPNRFPIVVRRNTASTPGLYGGSDCEKIRPQQQAINKIESRILKKLLRAGVTPVMPEDSSVSLSNAVFGQVIKMRPGESIDSYGKIDTTPDVSQDIKEADRLYNMARRILGISDSITGNEIPVQTSGVAMQLNIARGISRLESKRRLKYAAYAELYRIISGYFLSFYDGRRELCSRDAEGCLHTSVFTRGDFVEGSDGCYHLCPDYIFTVDLNFGGEYTKEALWERNLQNLKAGTLGDPCDARTLLRYWQFQESASYPYARENVKYFKSIIENERKEK